MNRTSSSWVVALAAGVFILIAGAGCEKGESSSNPLDATGLTASESAGEGIGMGPLADLTIEEIDKRLDLSDGQTTRMSQVLSQFRQERSDAREERRGRRGGRVGSGGGFGRGGAGEPPMIGFLEEASQILTPDQFKELALLIGEKRDSASQHRGRQGQGDPRHEGGAGDFEKFGERAAKHLGLTDEQMESVRPILKARAEEVRAIREQVRSGGLSREESRARMQAIHEETREQIHAFLTPEQIEKAESFRRERIEDRVEDRMERLDEQLDRRAAFLGRVLGLTDEQTAKVKSLILATSADRTALLEKVKAGTMEPPHVGEAIREIEMALAAEIEAILTDEQKARWEAVKELLPGRGPRP